MVNPLEQFIDKHQQSLFDPEQLSAVEDKLEAFLTEIAPKRPWHHGQFSDFVTGKILASLPTKMWRVSLMATLARMLPLELKIQQYRQQCPDHTMWGGSVEGEQLWQQRMNLSVAARELLRRQIPLKVDEITLLLLWLNFDDKLFGDVWLPMVQIINWILEHFDGQADKINEQQRELLIQIKLKLEPIKSAKNNRVLFEGLDALLDGRPRIRLTPGEAWSDVAIADLQAMDPLPFELWCGLISHCKTATGSKPTQKWLKRSSELVSAIGVEQLEQYLLSWWQLVPNSRNEVILDWAHLVADPNLLIIDEHMDILRGLCWAVAPVASEQLAKGIGELVLSALTRVDGVGERAVKVATGGILALGDMPDSQGLAVLQQLQSQVSFKTALKAVDKAIDKAQ